MSSPDSIAPHPTTAEQRAKDILTAKRIAEAKLRHPSSGMFLKNRNPR